MIFHTIRNAVRRFFCMKELPPPVPPQPMENLWLRVKLTDGTWENFYGDFPAGTAFMSVRVFRQFVKWFHGRGGSEYFRMGGSRPTCLPRKSILYYKLTREKA